jgi:ABC-2 type transport system ATP-binding protein
MPPLPRETMQKVLDLIRHDVATEKVEVETPTQNLESYFLEVVRKAKENLSETSGATSGSHVAAYLRGDADAAPAPEKILERLTQASAPKPAPAPVAPAPSEKNDEAKLAGLAKASEPRVVPAKPTAVPVAPADLSKANEKLSTLLGNPDEPKK